MKIFLAIYLTICAVFLIGTAYALLDELYQYCKRKPNKE